LLDGLEAECIGMPSELDKLGFNPRLDLDRFGLSPAREQKSVPDPSRPAERRLAETSQPDRDLCPRAGIVDWKIRPSWGSLPERFKGSLSRS
jgi:hypothetical protein